MAGGRFITRWLLLAVFLAILLIYFAVHVPTVSIVSGYNDYLSHSHNVDLPPVNQPMVEDEVVQDGLPYGRPTLEYDEATFITLEAIEIKPTRLAPHRPLGTSDSTEDSSDNSYGIPLEDVSTDSVELDETSQSSPAATAATDKTVVEEVESKANKQNPSSDNQNLHEDASNSTETSANEDDKDKTTSRGEQADTRAVHTT